MATTLLPMCQFSSYKRRASYRIVVCPVGSEFSESSIFYVKHYEEIEQELIDKVAKPTGLSGGELDRALFQNYGDILVRLLCP